MAKPRRVRWECPNGLHPAVLGSTRPLAEATVRFCLPCSEAEGKLVRRVAPALERKRVARQRQSAAAASVKARRAALRVTLLDFGDGDEGVEVDAGELLKRAWASETLKAARRDAGWHPRRAAPALRIRRGTRAERASHAGTERGRQRDTLGAHAKTLDFEIVMTVGPGCGREWFEAILVHEAAHMAVKSGEAHGRTWRSTYIRAMRELYGVVVENKGQATWRLDEDITLALRELGRSGKCM